MTKCQQYFITEPSRSVDYVRQEEAAPSGSQVQTAEPRDNIAFTSAGAKEERDKEAGVTFSSAEQT